MAKQIQKLELTWIGKGEEPKLEPRILIEDPSKSFGDSKSENMLIQGDNLLALKALEQDYTAKVKCIYIDPPYNTGNAFEHYDDGIEHSLWLSLIYDRLKILKTLLANDGAIFIQLDDNELDYCKIMCDELFGRENLVNRITIDARSPSAFSTVNPGVFKASEYILFYAKDRSYFKETGSRIPREVDYAYNLWLTNPNMDFSHWKFSNVLEAYTEKNQRQVHPKKALENYNQFIVDNADRVARYASISDSGAGEKIINLKKESLANKDRIYKLEREGKLDDVFVLNGQQIIFYSKNVVEIDGTKKASKLLTNIWTDIAWEGIASEGGVVFKKSKKPERLIRRVIELTTNPGDLVLDSFLGSGTTAAVAHKMGRRWIGVELGEHAQTHCYPRLKAVVNGEQSGISKAINWQGGGGFKFYTLAPSLVQKDKYGTEIINPQYNANMLAAAMAKQEGFRYQPDENNYWKQGMSSEKDFIFTTTQFVTVAMLDKLTEELKPGESLLVCCKSFAKGCANRHTNITIKKIPQMLLGRCEFGKDDYSFNIVNLPMSESGFSELEDEQDFVEESTKTKKKKGEADENQSTLF
jgi:adenine-specific DNA-methyltransferase